MPQVIFHSVPEYLVACLVMAVAQMVYVLFGFGSGLISVGLLALVFPSLQDVVVMLLLVNLPAEMFVVLRSWKVVAWGGVAALCAGIFVGIPVGTAVLQGGEASFVLTLLGGFLVAAGSVFLAFPEGRRVRWPAGVAPPVGLLSGVLTGLFGTGGPPLILYYQLSGVAKEAFRGSFMTIFLLKTLVRVPSYALGGLLTVPRIWSGLAVLPAVLLGIWLGNRIHLRISESKFRRAVSIALVAIGVLLLGQRLAS